MAAIAVTVSGGGGEHGDSQHEALQFGASALSERRLLCSSFSTLGVPLSEGLPCLASATGGACSVEELGKIYSPAKFSQMSACAPH